MATPQEEIASLIRLVTVIGDDRVARKKRAIAAVDLLRELLHVMDAWLSSARRSICLREAILPMLRLIPVKEILKEERDDLAASVGNRSGNPDDPLDNGCAEVANLIQEAHVALMGPKDIAAMVAETLSRLPPAQRAEFDEEFEEFDRAKRPTPVSVKSPVPAEFSAETAIPRLIEWISARGGKTTAKQLQQNKRRYPTAAAADQALDRLVKAGLGRWETKQASPRGGRPTKTFVLA